MRILWELERPMPGWLNSLEKWLQAEDQRRGICRSAARLMPAAARVPEADS